MFSTVIRQLQSLTGFLALIIGLHLPAVVHADEGRSLFESACIQCHGLAQIEQVRNGRMGWQETVDKMVIAGAQLNIEEMEVLIDYLVRDHGPDSSDPMPTGGLPFDSPLYTDGTVSGDNVVLPDGEGKLLVEGYCLLCHDAGRIVATRRGDKEWYAYVENMLARNSMRIPAAQSDILNEYLNQHFGRKD